ALLYSRAGIPTWPERQFSWVRVSKGRSFARFWCRAQCSLASINENRNPRKVTTRSFLILPPFQKDTLRYHRCAPHSKGKATPPGPQMRYLSGILNEIASCDCVVFVQAIVRLFGNRRVTL